MMPFLYFPENKWEYVPAAAFILITFVAAVFVMIFFIRHSYREEQKAKKFERERLQQLQTELAHGQQSDKVQNRSVPNGQNINSVSDS
jgi:uncharacterized membrane protein